MNDTLRRAIADAGLRETDIAARLGVNPRTVRRWVLGRVPYPAHRSRLADLLGVDEREFWPDISPSLFARWRIPDQVKETYPQRGMVPRDAWWRLFDSATREIGVLAYSGLFLAEDIGILRLFAEKASGGTAVRILLGDPDGPHVAERGAEEGIDAAMSAKIRNALTLYRSLREHPGIEVRLHDTTLYASIYRADDELMVNQHIYGVPAAHAPVLHLQKTTDGDIATTYLDSFERVWSNAMPLD